MRIFIAVLLLVSVGCDSDTSSTTDAGTDAGSDGGTPSECGEDTFTLAQCPETYPDDACVYYVDGDIATSGDGTSWNTPFVTIQEGINAAHCAVQNAALCPQWQVWVKSGTYYVYNGCKEDTMLLRDGPHMAPWTKAWEKATPRAVRASR